LTFIAGSIVLDSDYVVPSLDADRVYHRYELARIIRVRRKFSTFTFRFLLVPLQIYNSVEKYCLDEIKCQYIYDEMKAEVSNEFLPL
jgi:hypothetical protein